MACVLKQVPDTPDLEGPTGQKAVLVIKDHVGITLIQKAEYDGAQLVPDGTAVNKIELTIASGRNTLKVVYVFTASTAGRAELREDCDGGESQFLRDVRGDEPLQIIRITGN